MLLQECSFTISNYAFPADDAGFLTNHLDSLYGGKAIQRLLELVRNHAKDCCSDTTTITYSVDARAARVVEHYLIGPRRAQHRTGDFYPYMVGVYLNSQPIRDDDIVYQCSSKTAEHWAELCHAHPSVQADVRGVNNYTYLIHQSKQLIMALGSSARIAVENDVDGDRVLATIILPGEIYVCLYLG